MKPRRRVVVSVVASLAAAALLLAVGLFQGGATRLPTASLPSGSVASVDVALDAIYERQSAFAATSADAPKVEAVAAAVRRAMRVEEHKCATSGRLTFHKKDGWTVAFDLLAGHVGRYYEFRVSAGAEPGTYRVDRQPLQQALSALGAGPLDPGSPSSK
ncbi:MAG: hypothetical protein P4L85_11095 [Paludisphaera borealis]|uniref:hypothetical protein n=1 Tax=Paludisphaera borealis TaxID=1387353 RepID=UPI0028487BF4|nr:hypothetical protein [Paludisphaera borealis]MDR3619885.1 hypothetical protein [Paludisphaera borealis]